MIKEIVSIYLQNEVIFALFLSDDKDEIERCSDIPVQSSTEKYEKLTRDLDLIMNELSATQVNQDVVVAEMRKPVVTY